MNRLKIFLLAIVVLLIFNVGNQVSAARWRDLTVYNSTGYTIQNLFIAATATDNWGNDLLGGTPLLNGENTAIKYDADYEFYDLRIIFPDGKMFDWMGDGALNFSGSTMLVFAYIGDGKFSARVD